MQEYLPALAPLTIGLCAFVVGMIFALRERKASKLRNQRREHAQLELDLESGAAAPARSRQIG
jgi:hypothetical protein